MRMKEGIKVCIATSICCVAFIGGVSASIINRQSYNNVVIDDSKEWKILGEYKYPVNENGETYGKDVYDNDSNEQPDLIAVYGVDGTYGYIKATDGEIEPSNPEEAIELTKGNSGPKEIPVYDKDGKTIVSTFIIQ